MQKRILHFFLLLFSLKCVPVFCQKLSDGTKEKNRFKIALGGNVVRSHFRNTYSDDQFSLFYEGRLYLVKNQTFRGLLSFDNCQKTDFLPVWKNLKSTFFDAQMHIMFYFGQRAGMFYMGLGPTYQKFSAIYTGFESLAFLIPYKDKEFKTDNFGLTACFGFEFKIYKNIGLYAETRMRMMWSNLLLRTNAKNLSLNEELCLGLKINLPDLHKIFRGPNDNYHWF